MLPACQELSGSIAKSSWEAGSYLLPEISRRAGGILSAKTNGLNWQTVSRDQRSQLADCQPRPTVSTGRLSAKTNGLNWQTVSRDRRFQLADCQPRQTVSTGRLSAKTDGLNWQTVSQGRRSQLADCQPRPMV
ncbi:hypothetical protein PCANC_18617 [Puccinia coronata f. sp. avenae]|uniref:Uncharacterized protein n=1 Tax=Puccinia coronata f. sp. avenae TaxID=200324 RepID=A0A2N5UHM1_9BASI|nr:hypothetical protein PCANC_18617 [Puccinia coronata f. sp. avenae]